MTSITHPNLSDLFDADTGAMVILAIRWVCHRFGLPDYIRSHVTSTIFRTPAPTDADPSALLAIAHRVLWEHVRREGCGPPTGLWWTEEWISPNG